jgi:molybdopterin molybdotransferase
MMSTPLPVSFLPYWKNIKMLTVDQARDWLLQRAQPVRATETLPLLQALGRILAEPVISGVDVPPQDNSAMDGYALHSADGNGPCRFPSAFLPGLSRSIEGWHAARILPGHPFRRVPMWW